MTKRILIAEIVGAHGIKGFAKVNFFGEEETLLVQPLYVDEAGNKQLTLKVKSKNKNQFIVEIEGVNDRTQCETLKKTKLYIERDNLPDVQEGEVYHIDLIGKKAFTQDGKEVGDIIAVENFGASDLLEIKPKRDASFYLPYTDRCVLEIRDDGVIVDVPALM